jgi:Low-density lipoprotein receptor domain class A
MFRCTACEDGDQVECINGFQCIYVWHVCDGEKDCWDASDENGCRTGDL